MQQPDNQDISFLAGLFTVFLCIIFGSNAIAMKITFEGFGVFTSAGLRFATAAIVIFVWSKASGRSVKLTRGLGVPLILYSLLFTLQLSLFYYGISKTYASRGTLLVNLLPFYILILAHFFIPGDHITKRKLLGILLGFSGVAFVFLERKGISADLRLGDLMILTASFVWSCTTVYLKRIIHNYDPHQIVFYSMVFSTPVLFLEATIWDQPMIGNLNVRVLGALLYQSLVVASVGFVAWNGLLKKYGAVALHSYIFIVPIAGVILGGLVLNEPITLKIVVAAATIVAGILVVHLKPKKPAPAYPFRRSL
jgi:drug/metabolite transporter (DMT)-like permease